MTKNYEGMRLVASMPITMRSLRFSFVCHQRVGSQSSSLLSTSNTFIRRHSKMRDLDGFTWIFLALRPLAAEFERALVLLHNFCMCAGWSDSIRS